MSKIIKKASLIAAIIAILVIIGTGIYDIIKLKISNNNMVKIKSENLLKKEYRS